MIHLIHHDPMEAVIAAKKLRRQGVAVETYFSRNENKQFKKAKAAGAEWIGKIENGEIAVKFIGGQRG